MSTITEKLREYAQNAVDFEDLAIKYSLLEARYNNLVQQNESSSIVPYRPQAADDTTSQELVLLQRRYDNLVDEYSGRRDDYTQLEQNYRILQNKYTALEDLTTTLQTELIDLRQRNIDMEQSYEVMQQQASKIDDMQLDYEFLRAEFETATAQQQEYENNIEKFIDFLQTKFDISRGDSFDTIRYTITYALDESAARTQEYVQEVARLQQTINTLQSSTSDKEKQLFDMIEILNRNISSELANIDTELVMYGGGDDGADGNFDMNPLDPTNFLRIETAIAVDTYTPDFLPFLRFITEQLDLNDDFSPDNVDVLMFQSYVFFILQLLGIYSRTYIRQYINGIYREYKRALATPDKLLRLPALVLPQTLHTNSLYYLMNRYNTKAYQPDRVLDFGDFIFNFLKPQFRPDTTLALNLFQANIGQRYNSILIYSPETIDKLLQLQKTLNEILA